MFRFKSLIPAIFLLLFATILNAGGPGTAKYAGEFLSLGAGSRSLGMGSAFVAVSRDVTAGYWNPAGLAFINYPEIMLMHSDQFSSLVKYDYGGFALPVGERNSLGLTVIRVGVDDIIKTELPRPDLEVGATFVDDKGQLVRNTPREVGQFSSADYAFFLTYAKKPSDGFALGGNVKFLYRSLGDHSAWGVGFDLGLMFNPVSNLQVGINFKDLTSTLVAWDTGRRELITPSLHTGFSYPIYFSVMGGRVQPALDFVFRFENRRDAADLHVGRVSADVNMGWEYTYQDVFSVRVGSSEV
ncbi:MAG: hypothetical protein D6743_11560, partial [Calditrichaeota bacterium]